MKTETEIRERLDWLHDQYRNIHGNDIDIELDAAIGELVLVLGYDH